MDNIIRKISPICLILLTFFVIDSTVTVYSVDARSRMGGRMFSRPAPKKAPVQQNMKQTNQTTQKSKGSFGKGLAGGLLGGALGAMLFGSLFGASGEGMGILPLLLLAGVGYFLFRRMTARAGAGRYSAGGGSPDMFSMPGQQTQHGGNPQEQFQFMTEVEQGIEEIKKTDRHFDQAHFVEVASDVFFRVQAGWMRRDLDSYKHLLGEQLASEYASHFEEMRQNGHINKLESIAIRKVELVNAGSDGKEDFATVLFTANLLDYTVDEQSGDIVDGSNSTPVKFAEEWTWARQTGRDNWLLEGIKVVSG